MMRLRKVGGVSILLISAATLSASSTSRFNQKLPPDRQAVHVLRRLTFGPRPGDLQQIRKLGVQKWIDLQLHPDRIPENVVLDEKLKALTTLNQPLWQLFESYGGAPPVNLIQPPSAIAMSSLAPQDRTRLLNCSVDERETILNALDPEKRQLVLGAIPPNMLNGLPEALIQEATTARQREVEARNQERRRQMPPLRELLTPEQLRVANSGRPEEKLALLDSFDQNKRRQVLRMLPMQSLAAIPALRREAMAASQPQQFVNFELTEQKLLRAVYSNRQLEEVLVDFWVNHFNVFNGKGPARILLTSFERDAIRPYVFGKFKDMLLATARHPAMLYYLDNWQSQSPRDDLPVPPPGVRRPGLNENYGREIMELHTLGVDGGYTQADVVAVARAFTGWTIYDPQRFAEYQFNPAFHDRKEKVILGHVIPAMGAEQDGLQVIDLLAHHPSTAAFISRKLAQRFVADDPPKSLVDRMAATFSSTDGDLRAVLQTLFSSTEFLSDAAWQSKVKSPLEMVVSAVRAVAGDVSDTFVLAQRIADLGEPLYGKVEPTGYPNTSEGWTNTAGVLGRINFATALASDQIPGVKVDRDRFSGRRGSDVAADLLNGAPSASTLTAIEKGVAGSAETPSLLPALVIASPDFQRR
jgi:uncharacterized protein (DUF1800 family)